MKPLILFGSGGHCKACIDVIESSNEYKIKGIVVHPQEEIKEFMQYKIIGNDSNLNNFSSKISLKEGLLLICAYHSLVRLILSQSTSPK